MPTDSTELTFVRCPSCRSLVPAISTRCRMCGAGLDASVEGDVGQDDKKSGRVRQRTMSQPQSELNQAVSKVRAQEAESIPTSAPTETSIPQPTSIAAEPQGSSEEDAGDDPLSAYIEEVEGEDEAVTPKVVTEKIAAARPVAFADRPREPHAPVESEQNVSSPKPAEHQAVGQLASVSTVPAAHVIIPKSAASKAPSAVESREVSIPKAAMETPAKPSSGSSNNAVKANSAPEVRDEGSQRVIIESGMRRQGKGSGLSFGKGRDAAPDSGSNSKQVYDEVAKKSESAPSIPAPRAEPVRAEQSSAHSSSVEAATQRATSGLRSHETQISKEQSSATSQERTMNASPKQNKTANNLKKSENSLGRLFGWLVNYSDPDGQATELREGKFFVTASSLKDSDLIIDDTSISTPHALVNVSVDGGLQVQDLMSDRGVFVRRRGADTYQREPETISIEHGDWLRFGDVEYLVSLVAHVGLK